MVRKIKNISYNKRTSCPFCSKIIKKTWSVNSADLECKQYYFGGYQIPAVNIIIYTCPSCNFLFKDNIPTVSSLSSLFSASIGVSWSSYYNYNEELELAKKYCPKIDSQILDIGSSNGDLIRKFNSYYSSVSALDFVQNKKCVDSVTGEYILSLLDDSELSWSGIEFDLITLFDVVEHLFDVKQGLVNLNKLTRKNGYVIMETGDAESSLPKKFGANKWWYLNLIEHHQAFTKASLFKLAKESGFKIEMITHKRHKHKKMLSIKGVIWRQIKTIIYKMSVLIYYLVFQTKMQPIPPLEADHFIVILRKETSIL